MNILSKFSSSKKWLLALIIAIPVIVIVGGALYVANRQARLESGKDFYKLEQSQIQFFEDSSHTLQIEDIAAMSPDDFKALPEGNAPNFGFNTSAVWLRFELTGGMIRDERKFLEVKNPLLNEVELFQMSGGEIWQVNATGDTRNFSSRKHVSRNFVFELDLPFNKSGYYFMKVSSGGEQLLAPISIWSESALAIRDSEDQWMRGSYFGLIIFVLLFNLFIYFIIKERSTLYYVYYNLFLVLLQLSLGGYAFQYLWPGSPYLANVMNPFFASMGVFMLIRFSQHFLEVHSYYPKANKWFNYAGYLLLFNAGLSLIPIGACFFASILIVNGTTLILNLAIIPTAWGVMKKNFKPAGIFLAAFLLLVLTVFGFLATNAGAIRSEFFADYGLLIGSAVEVILLSIAIVVRFKSFKDQALSTLQELNKVQAEQNQVLEQKVVERTHEIQLQKTEIEHQKEEILSSIRYAERIQKNVLPAESDIKSLFPDSMVYYRPKDIVSGDFYWVGKTKLNGVVGPPHEVLLMATGDCTGHGVPGAMVSVLGCNLLRETVLQYPEETPDKILDKLDDRLLSAIKGTEHDRAGDGMDIALWALQTDTLTLRFSGANRGVSVYRNGEWLELNATRRPIGMRDRSLIRDFELHEMQLQKGDVIYAWTDGIIDQMGGTDGKKLKTKGLKALLEQIVHKPMSEQHQAIHDFLNAFMHTEEQIDDISLTAVRI